MYIITEDIYYSHRFIFNMITTLILHMTIRKSAKFKAPQQSSDDDDNQYFHNNQK